MINLINSTLLIPIRFDFQERIDNLKYVLNYLNNNLKINIFLYEESIQPNFQFLEKKVTKYKFFYSNNEYFHRTKLINNMVKDSSTDIVIVYDSDIILDVNSYVDSYNKILNEQYDLVIPYQYFWNLDKEQSGFLIKNKIDISNINLSKCRRRRINSVGGSIFFKKESYIKGGMENENFKSWGAEDDERIYRFKTLGYKIYRLNDYKLYHLYHPRGINSMMHTTYYQKNLEEFKKVSDMNKEQLVNYIKTWRE